MRIASLIRLLLLPAAVGLVASAIASHHGATAGGCVLASFLALFWITRS